MSWYELRRAARTTAVAIATARLGATREDPAPMAAARGLLEDLVSDFTGEFTEAEVLRALIEEQGLLQAATVDTWAAMWNAPLDELTSGFMTAFVAQAEQLEADGLL